jgi:DNA-binding transcriptional regulator YiaG
MAKNFKELQAKMSSESRARSEEAANKMLAEMGLVELREAMDLTQEALAETLNVKQASISKMERRSDMYISTLSKIIEAMGGHLRMVAEMPNGKVEIRGFSKVRSATNSSREPRLLPARRRHRQKRQRDDRKRPQI